MKYAFFILSILSLFSFLSTNSFAVTITSFNDSPALMNVLEFIKDSGSDLKVSNRISERELTISDVTKCTDVSAVQVMSEVESAIHNVLRYYPDEELPLDEAYNDLATLLGSHLYKKCTFYYSNDSLKMKTNYFFNSSNSVHIKVDTITLLAQ